MFAILQKFSIENLKIKYIACIDADVELEKN